MNESERHIIANILQLLKGTTLPPYHLACHHYSYCCCCHGEHWNSLPHPSKSKQALRRLGTRRGQQAQLLSHQTPLKARRSQACGE
jgi:hypothetical protein